MVEQIIDRVAPKQMPQQRPDGSFHPGVTDANIPAYVSHSPLFFEIVMNSIRYSALSNTGLSIRGWLSFKDNEGNALNV